MNKTIYYDEENRVYTLTLVEAGGPIISDETLDVANEKFDQAFKLSKAVKYLIDLKNEK